MREPARLVVSAALVAGDEQPADPKRAGEGCEDDQRGHSVASFSALTTTTLSLKLIPDGTILETGGCG